MNPAIWNPLRQYSVPPKCPRKNEHETRSYLAELARVLIPESDFGVLDESSDQYLGLEWIGYKDAYEGQFSTTEQFIDRHRYSLVVLYFSTSGRAWTSNNLWLPGEHHCSWELVVCNDDNRIEELNLSDNGLRGMLPTVLGNLIFLQTAKFASNQIRGNLPTELGRTALVTLRVNSNKLAGAMPSELGHVGRLKTLDAANNTFEIESHSNLDDLQI